MRSPPSGARRRRCAARSSPRSACSCATSSPEGSGGTLLAIDAEGNLPDGGWDQLQAVIPGAVVTGDAFNILALRRSAGLTRGNWLRTLGVIVTLTAIALVIAVVLSSIGLAFPEGAARNVGTSVFGLIGNALTVPIIALGTFRLYRALEAQASARRSA